MQAKNYKMSRKYGEKWLSRQGYSVRRKTTDRITNPFEAKNSSKEFYERLSEPPIPSAQMIINLDETFLLFEPENRGKWTWHKSIDRDRVPMKASKLGFTWTFAITANGDVVAMQGMKYHKNHRDL